MFVVSGPGPIGFHLFLGKEHGQSNENQEDNPMIKALRFLTICTISIAFATIESAQIHTRTAGPGASATSLNGGLATLAGGVARERSSSPSTLLIVFRRRDERQ